MRKALKKLRMMFKRRSGKPELGEVAVVRQADVFTEYPSVGLTPQRLAAIFKEADQGDIRQQAELFEELEEKDARLFSVLQTRKQAVLGLPWEIEGDDERINELVKVQLSSIKDFDDAMLDLLDAIGKGFAVAEIMWELREGQVWVDELRWRHQKRFRFNDTLTELLLVTDQHVNGRELPESKFVIHKYKARSGHPNRAGVLRVAAWMYLFKHFGIKDWVIFAETYGMPLRLGKYDQAASPADRATLRRALRSLGTDAAGVISKATEIEFIQATQKASSVDVFDRLINLANTEITLAVLGQNLTSEVKGGSFAAAQVHDDVRQDLVEADCIALQKTLNEQLIRPLVDYNYGPQKTYPRLKFAYEPPEDLAAQAERDKILIETGLPVPADYMYEKYRIPKPEKGEAVVVPWSHQAVEGEAAPAPTAASRRLIMREGRFTPEQEKVEQLADNTIARAAGEVHGLAGAVKQAVEESANYEELQEKLVVMQQQYALEDFEELLARALFIADLYGHQTVVDEHE